ncbi:MAG TPA: methyltransferase domain-containing protein [Acidimicrobiales bacterium]|nr:methyltransferase domain-containing protein [Acidimicrobiales bacterium]
MLSEDSKRDRGRVNEAVRGVARRSERLRDLYTRSKAARVAFRSPGDHGLSFDDLVPSAAFRMAYNVILQREPDPHGTETLLPAVEAGALSYPELVETLWGSEEFMTHRRFWRLGPSLHSSRCEFIRTLPQGRRILDLGGTHQHRDEGALVAMGYPYDFDELIIVDLPVDDRHEIYQARGSLTEVPTERGPVRYQYHSMADLSRYESGSFDLVYSGQTFEHVTEADGDAVLEQALRVLRPGGHMAIDTPNGRVTRLQQEEFIDPDHEVEYDEPTLTTKIQRAGFEVVTVQGLNHLGAGAADDTFSMAEVAHRSGIYAAAADCYLLAYICRKPA